MARSVRHLAPVWARQLTRAEGKCYNFAVLGAEASGTLIFDTAGDEADSLAPGKSLDWGTDMLVVSANRNKVIRVTVYLASNENDQISDRGWVDGCVKCIGLIVCPHFARPIQISVRALGRASFEICEGVRSLFVRNGVAPYNERVGQGCKSAVLSVVQKGGARQGARRKVKKGARQ